MWRHRRSAPEGVLLVGALMLVITSTVGTVFYVAVVRAARGLSVYSAGLPRASLASPTPLRAAYELTLRGPDERRTPAGTSTVAHRWLVTQRARPLHPLCSGDASEGLYAQQGASRFALAVPVPDTLWTPSEPRPVPPFLFATCPALAAHEVDSLEYREQTLAPQLPVTVVACAQLARARLGGCDDGTPARIYLRESGSRARVAAREALRRVCLGAAVFALLCFAVGLGVLHRFASPFHQDDAS